AQLQGTRSVKLINSPYLRNEDLAGLSQFSQLDTLHINGTPIGNEGLSHIAKISHLRDLNIFATPVSDPGVVHLRGLRELRTLHLAVTVITDEGLKNLSELEQLEWLALVKCRSVTGTGFRSLHKLQKLKYLDMNLTGLNDEGLAAISQLGAIESLHVTSAPITDVGLASVGRLKKLRQFHPNNTSTTDAGVEHLASCTELEELWLNDTRVGDGALAVAARLPSLSVLGLQRTAITDEGLPLLYRHPSLRLLMLAGTKVNDDAVTKLRRELPECEIDFPSLDHRVADRCLEFNGSVQFQGMQSPLTHRSQLVRDDRAFIQSFDLTGRNLPPDLLASVAKLQSLHSLKLSSTSVTQMDLKLLSTSPQLACLWLIDTRVDDTCGEVFANTRTLALLDLSGTKVSDNVLAKMPDSLKSLYLNRTGITDRGLSHLVRLKHLTELRLQDTKTTGEGINSLKQALPQCSITH
ncbi:MAG: hypothetical protein R3C99_27865, partial [Pirellulaceae bacterium]